jgi:DNA-binding CsgD family transcriptional regulator
MSVNLLERDGFLRTLEHLLAWVEEGSGRIALVIGEAGIGKTSLVERFLRHRSSILRVLWGGCEALFTPRPLGPLYDIALETQSSLHALLEGVANRAVLFPAVLNELKQAPTVLVIEDIHWADEATLDLIKYLGRRISRTPILLILTFRDDELARDHPLRLVLGDLPAREVTRLRLPPLSEDAVATLAREAHRPSKDLYLATGGNPFFLSEVLASEATGVPASVSDVVLAQVARRSPEAQRLLDLIAVVPNKIESWVLEAIGASDRSALDECLAAGILHLEGEAVGFRHELARQAVASALSRARSRSLHAAVLHALLVREDRPIEIARLVHHAALAQDAEQVLRLAPEAAREASDRGAHREAVEQYQTALRYADRLDPAARADLLERLAYECLLTGQMPLAIQAGEDALALWRELEIPQRVGHNLRWLSRVYWYAGQRTTASRYVDAAVSLLETLPPDTELGWAYNYRAMFAMLAEESTDARIWGERAFELAERLDDDELVIHALNTRGMTLLYAGDPGGRDQMSRSLRLALERGLEEHAGRAYGNFARYFARYREYADAYDTIAEGIAYCVDHDLDLYIYEMQSWRALAAFEQGRWTSAVEDATAVLGSPGVPPIDRIQALVALGWVRARRGDPGADVLLDEARDLALGASELQRIAPVMAARAEAAWLRADLAACAAQARVGFDLACAHDNPWALGQLAFWLYRAGALTEPPASAATPFALQMAGDWHGAATAWEQLGCPYEQALALLDGDEPAQRQALALFEQLGARPAAELARRQLRLLGVQGLPRGPRPSTQANPRGLTPRQLEILLLLVEGLHNAEIAEQLAMTPKTVEHHVSAVLAKLDARSRAEAVRVAHDLGLVSQTATPPKMGGAPRLK